jgi:hypothetical protein
MNLMKKQFRELADLLKAAGFTGMAERVEKDLADLASDTYKIVVAGEFKTGKSTLINRVFLKEDLLFTDIMEATAVPTEICYGSEKLLEVFPYAAPLDKAAVFDDDRPGMELSTDEGPPQKISAPSVRDIQSWTSSDTPEGRTRLANRISRVKLWWPSGNLEGLTLFDTPGINSLNAAVIATTYRIIPQADLVLFVTSARQLSQVELEFLSGRVFNRGITRAVTVVTCDGDEALSEQKRDRLRSAIQNQLRHIGRENVPVELVNILDRDENDPVPGFWNQVESEPVFKEKIPSRQAANDVISDLLGEKRPSSRKGRDKSPLPGTGGLGIAALERSLVRFIRENVRPARIEKAERTLKIWARLGLIRCGAEISALEKNKTGRERMLSEVRAREAEMRLAHERMTAAFRDDLLKVRREFERNAETGFKQIWDSYMTGFNACESLGEIQARLKKTQTVLKRDMEDVLLDCSARAREGIRSLAETYGFKSQSLLGPWQAEVTRDLNIDGGILSKIPSFALLALDIMLFIRFGPFGPLADILIRLLAHYIPFVNKALPVSIAAGLLKMQIRNSLNEQYEKIRSILSEQTESMFSPVIASLLAEWSFWVEEQVKAVRESVEAVINAPEDPERAALLAQTQIRLEILYGSERDLTL